MVWSLLHVWKFTHKGKKYGLTYFNTAWTLCFIFHTDLTPTLSGALVLFLHRFWKDIKSSPAYLTNMQLRNCVIILQILHCQPIRCSKNWVSIHVLYTRQNKLASQQYIKGFNYKYYWIFSQITNIPPCYEQKKWKISNMKFRYFFKVSKVKYNISMV